jgi:DNA-binding transcriptional MerR regulator/methylmalonyl-CoA mutase cobalamin-binding subunit
MSNYCREMASPFSIQTAAERSGLSPHVIRAWERRYRAIEPERSTGRQRQYSEAEIERLATLHRAVRCGYSIGKIAHLPTEKLSALLAESAAAPRALAKAAPADAGSTFRAEALAATERFAAPGLETALRGALVELGHQGLLRLVVAPLAEEIGERWRTGALTAAHEHFFTASVKVFLSDLTRQFAAPLDAPRVIVGTPAGQLHELGAIMAASTAANLGWRPVYLGPSLPAHEIAGAALRNDAAAVALSLVYPEDDPQIPHELTELARLLPAGVRILVGGRAARGYFETLVRIGALFAASLEELGTQLDTVRRSAARISRR